MSGRFMGASKRTEPPGRQCPKCDRREPDIAFTWSLPHCDCCYEVLRDIRQRKEEESVINLVIVEEVRTSEGIGG
jgi:hypothetical protein